MAKTLPGVRVTLSDAYYSANDTNPDAQRVLLIAAKGAGAPASLYNPVQYLSEVQCLEACGLGSQAHIAYVQAVRSGASNIYVAVTDPTKTTVAEREAELATALSFADMVEPDIIVPFGFYANEVVPGEAGSPIVKTITAISGISGETAVTITATAHGFSENDSVTIAGVQAPNTALNAVYTISEILSTNRFVVNAASPLAGDIALTALTGVTATKAGGAGARIVANAKNLGLKCHQLMRDLNPCIGVMALSPIAGDDPTASDIQTYVDEATAELVTSLGGKTTLPVANILGDVKSVTPAGETNAVDLGRYLCLCVGKVIVRGQPDDVTTHVPEFTSCEAVVAGQIYSTPLEDAITSTPITNVIGLSNTFSRAQKIALITNQVNPVCLNSVSQIITLDGWTLASPNTVTGDASVYDRLSTVRIVNEIVKSTRNELEKFIGMQASTARLNSIETKLRGVYTAFKQAGVLRNAEFKIAYSQSTGTLTVDLNLVPFGEIREVSVTVAVKINA